MFKARESKKEGNREGGFRGKRCVKRKYFLCVILRMHLTIEIK